jgi:4,5-dihydroxyphthalate decarboxylase
VEEIFYRFIRYREWQVSELSFAKYAAMRANGTADFTAIPVFPSRAFRSSSMFVRADSTLRAPEDLLGRRVGVPEWAQTAAVYTRGWLSESLGLDLAAIDWVQAGVNQPGRREKVELHLPNGIRLTSMPDDTLTGLLLRGEIDAVFSAHPPAPFESNTGEIRQLLPDPMAIERSYYDATGIFPIMHVIAISDSVLTEHPWVAQNLFKAFTSARNAGVGRLLDLTASRVPLPWAAVHARQAIKDFGELFPYGVASNLATLEAFLRFCATQGVTSRMLTVGELFAATVQSTFRI